MSLMGYEEDDVLEMMASINIAKSYLPANSSNDEVRSGLQKSYDFFDCLLIEGRV